MNGYFLTATLGELKEVEMPGIEPGASYMRSMRSTTELHPPCVGRQC